MLRILQKQPFRTKYPLKEVMLRGAACIKRGAACIYLKRGSYFILTKEEFLQRYASRFFRKTYFYLSI